MVYKRIVVLTGAGISAESGIKTFRDNNGLWENHSVEEVATPEGFLRDPALVYRFYNDRRNQLLSASVAPNAAHKALAKLERQFGDNLLLVTQNVDNLHEQGGSNKVLHMHGELLSGRCCVSGQVFDVTTDFDDDSRCTCCQPAQKIRPNIVWFTEMPMFMEEIYQALAQADLFISIGTSGNVYPAAGFVAEANHAGAHTVELNLQPSMGQNYFAEKIYGKAGDIVPVFVEKLLSKLC
jgi:NAD-dependent deacetylase